MFSEFFLFRRRNDLTQLLNCRKHRPTFFIDMSDFSSFLNSFLSGLFRDLWNVLLLTAGIITVAVIFVFIFGDEKRMQQGTYRKVAMDDNGDNVQQKNRLEEDVRDLRLELTEQKQLCEKVQQERDELKKRLKENQNKNDFWERGVI